MRLTTDPQKQEVTIAFTRDGWTYLKERFGPDGGLVDRIDAAFHAMRQAKVCMEAFCEQLAELEITSENWGRCIYCRAHALESGFFRNQTAKTVRLRWIQPEVNTA